MFYQEYILANASIATENLRAILGWRGLRAEEQTLVGQEVLTPESARMVLETINALSIKDEQASHARTDARRALQAVLDG